MQLFDKEWENELNSQGSPVENSYLRRLLRILKLPTTDLKRKKKKAEEDKIIKRQGWYS